MKVKLAAGGCCLLSPIFAVAQNGMANMKHVHAQLMGTSRLGRQFKPGKLRNAPFLQPVDGSVMGDGAFSSFVNGDFFLMAFAAL